MRKNNKLVIYQMFPRLFTNTNVSNTFNGTIEQNGVGKINDIDGKVLESLKDLGVTHMWYTGVIEHATKTDYTQYGIQSSNPHVVKGNAGSPYAIRDYYDIDPDIAVDVPNRIHEFENLVNRTHANGMKVLIVFVPNHEAREYLSDAKPRIWVQPTTRVCFFRHQTISSTSQVKNLRQMWIWVKAMTDIWNFQPKLLVTTATTSTLA